MARLQDYLAAGRYNIISYEGDDKVLIQEGRFCIVSSLRSKDLRHNIIILYHLQFATKTYHESQRAEDTQQP